MSLTRIDTLKDTLFMNSKSSIAAIGVALPSLVLPMETLAAHLGADPAKFLVGLGARNQALCDEDETAVTLGVRAAKDALERWGGDRARIGMIAVGTESALDMSRPLSAWIAEALALPDNVRSYEIKHACQAGTIAVRQAVEWQLSGASRGKAALVVCTDEALYRPGHPGEPTQGAAAVALVIDHEGFAALSPISWSWQKPAFDFWRPVGEAYPEVDGPFSVRCYQEAFTRCTQQWEEDPDAEFRVSEVDLWAMHAPFPKMVWKGFQAGLQALGLSDEDARAQFDERVLPSLEWNVEVGNCYTASTWLALARALTHEQSAQRLALFSYGSGCGAELMLIQRTGEVPAIIAEDVREQLHARRPITAEEYLVLRATR